MNVLNRVEEHPSAYKSGEHTEINNLHLVYQINYDTEDSELLCFLIKRI